MTAPRPDLRLRAAHTDDLPAITAVLDAATRAWVGRPTTPDQAAERLATPGTDPARDTAIAFDPGGEAVGFGHLWRASPHELRCFARTHPYRCGLGVGTALQRSLIARAAELAERPDTELTTTTWPGDTGAERLLPTVGYQPARYFLRMEIDLAPDRPRPVPVPAGIAIRTAEPGDDTALFAAFAESFADHWGTRDPDPDAWWHERRTEASAAYDPSLWLLATDGDELAGFAISRVVADADGGEQGYVGDLGVRPRWRGRGLGECLLVHSLQALRERGLTLATLDVDAANTSGAVRLYTKVGMRQRQNFTIWSQRVHR